jgi:PKD repeat protein
MRLTFFTFLIILLIPYPLFCNDSKIFVSGYIVNSGSGSPVADHMVLLKFKNQDPPFLYVDDVATNGFGYYSFLLDLPFSKGNIQISTYDCSNQLITRSIEFNPSQTVLHCDFTICHNQQASVCLSDFIWVRDPLQPNKVSFRQSAFGAIDTYTWEFGDGATSSEPDPTHYYTEDGIYDVCLQVSDSNAGCSDMVCYSIRSHDDTLIQSNFTHYPVPGDSPTIQYQDISLGNVISWFWEFGDGRALSDQNPRHTYAEPGIYTVCLIAGKSGNQYDTICMDIDVSIPGACNASFIAFADPADLMTRHFIDLSSAEAVTWNWDFGDGNTSAEQHPVHTFADEGFYKVSLAVANESNSSDTFTLMEQVSQQPGYIAHFSVFAFEENGHTFRFVGLSAGNPDKWYWDFGDGTVSELEHPVHTFAENGTYQVCLTVSDQNQTVQDTFCETVFVAMTTDCEALFTYEQDTGNALTWHFTSASRGDDLQYFWEFGDGHTSNEENPTHVFGSESAYQVCLTVEDMYGNCADSYCHIVNVAADPALQALYDVHQFPDDPQTVQFVNRITGTHNIRIWDFDDGNREFTGHPRISFADTGTFQVALHVLNSETGAADQHWQTVDILSEPDCRSAFTGLQSIVNPMVIRFVSLSEGEIADYYWDFGDGNSSALKNPVHTYVDGGEFEVCLTVTDFTGTCTDQFCMEITVGFEMMCEADFDHVPAQDQSLTVEFIDQSQGIVNHWEWDFGDGHFSDVQNPAHAYADSGYYSVTLHVSNTDSINWCNHTITKEIYVFAPLPDCQAGFIAHPDSGVNKPNLFHFHDMSAGEPDSWYWDFGDGQTSSEQHPVHQYEESGSYEVTLTIDQDNPFGEDCSDTWATVIETPNYFHIGGFIFAGHFPINNPVPTGDTSEILLYRYTNNHVVPVDTSSFTENGYYYSLFLLQDHYLIKSRLTDGSVNASDYFPTYFGDHLLWQNADLCYIADSNHFQLDIHLHALPEIESGIGSISGSVFRSFAGDQLTWPAFDTQVLLFDQELQPLTYEFTRNAGNFDFDALALGTYFLVAESTGKLCEKIEVTLTEANPEVKDVLLEIYDPGATPVIEQTSGNYTAKVFPNPVTEKLFVDLNSPGNASVECIVLNISGQRILHQGFRVNAGSNLLSIPTSQLMHGVYILQVRHNEQGKIQTLKFVK